jgi:hypothetical protein
VILGVELRALHLLLLKSFSQPFLHWLFLRQGLALCLDHYPPIVLPYTAGMTSMHHCAQPLVEMGSCELFTKAVLKLQSSLVSTSQVATISGLSHQAHHQVFQSSRCLLRTYFIIFCDFLCVLHCPITIPNTNNTG